MSTGRTAIVWQIVRIALLLGLLRAASPAYTPAVRALQRVETNAFWLPWAWLVLVGAVFCVVALAARGPHQSRVVLLIEAVVAAVLAFTPPPLWLLWFGLDGLPTTLGVAAGSLFAQALALAWLVAAVLSLVRTIRGGRSSPTTTASSPTG